MISWKTEEKMLITVGPLLIISFLIIKISLSMRWLHVLPEFLFDVCSFFVGIVYGIRVPERAFSFISLALVAIKSQDSFTYYDMVHLLIDHIRGPKYVVKHYLF